jgi:mono/diheme cytochrome c family protein
MKILIALAVVGTAAGAGFLYSGVYNVGADVPHWSVTAKMIDTFRERSIAARIKEIDVPGLDDARLVAEGAEHFSAMCSGCHLAPGMQDTEIRAGLYPQPPNLAEHQHAHGHGDSAASAARQFWIIKHGIKMTAMPAWGATHDDQSIWGLVAFLQKLPGMAPVEYATLAGNNGHGDDSLQHTGGGDEHSNHQHGDSAAASAGHMDVPGTPPHSHGDDKHSEEAHKDEDHAN